MEVTLYFDGVVLGSSKRPGGGIGRHAGLKILWPEMAVTVRPRSWVQDR